MFVDLQAAQTAVTTAAAGAAHSFATEGPANVGTALAIVPALEWMKRHGGPLFKWVNDKSAPSVALTVALAAAIGIHFSFDAGAGTATITGLTLAGIAQGLLEVAKQWLAQHWIFKGYQGFDTLKSVAVALNKMSLTETPSVTGATAATEGKR